MGAQHFLLEAFVLARAFFRASARFRARIEWLHPSGFFHCAGANDQLVNKRSSTLQKATQPILHTTSDQGARRPRLNCPTVPNDNNSPSRWPIVPGPRDAKLIGLTFAAATTSAIELTVLPLGANRSSGITAEAQRLEVLDEVTAVPVASILCLVSRAPAP